MLWKKGCGRDILHLTPGELSIQSNFQLNWGVCSSLFMSLFENEKKIQTIPTSGIQTIPTIAIKHYQCTFLLSKKSINVKNRNQKLWDVRECVFSIRKEIKLTVNVSQRQSHQEAE